MISVCLALAIGLVAVGIVLLLAPFIRQYRAYGYVGVFLVNVLGNGTILVPVPSAAVNYSVGAVLSWPIVGLIAGVGAALGEVVSYSAGRGGSAVANYRPHPGRMTAWLDQQGMVVLFLLSAVPNPLTDVACLWAGLNRYSFGRFMIAVWLGKTLKAMTIAWAGAQSVSWLLRLAQ